jgi:hypothetical protein
MEPGVAVAENIYGILAVVLECGKELQNQGKGGEVRG